MYSSLHIFKILNMHLSSEKGLIFFFLNGIGPICLFIFIMEGEYITIFKYKMGNL